MRIRKEALTALAIATALTACSSSDDSPDTGTLSLSLMDAPVDGVAELWVTISGIWIKPSGDGPAIPLDLAVEPGETTITVNLLELGYENASVLVDSAEVEARSYNWIELQIEDAGVNESYLMTDDGGMYDVDVDVPSGRIRLVSGFDVGPNQGVRIYFDWDVRKGLTDPVGQEGYLLRPAFRVLRAEAIGELSGTIASGTCTEPANPVVYIYEGEPVALGDLASDSEMPAPSDAPHMTVDADLNIESGLYEFSTVVMPGLYTVALLCDGADDTVATDDMLEFADTLTVEVSADIATPAIEFSSPI